MGILLWARYPCCAFKVLDLCSNIPASAKQAIRAFDRHPLLTAPGPCFDRVVLSEEGKWLQFHGRDDLDADSSSRNDLDETRAVGLEKRDSS